MVALIMDTNLEERLIAQRRADGTGKYDEVWECMSWHQWRTANTRTWLTTSARSCPHVHSVVSLSSGLKCRTISRAERSPSTAALMIPPA